ncbi:E3 UFM1-protein ligase 1 homolog [Periplaneta americana]|uniref:E3 UFM1-protein ligase 1 homolog n=1 Tax=Periplaneta americana TaxID=6978 RepID=UPI0037E8E07D
MTAVEWDEVKRLAADFQRAQLSSTVQRLSERNCVEIVTKLLDLKLLDVIFTTDGKEYVTPQQLTREIRDELYVHGGRINLVELAKLLNVDLSQITARATEIDRVDQNCSLVLGQLIDKTYLNHIAEEINERLLQQGQVTIGDLTRHYDLPSDFLQTVVEKQLGKTIHGKQDKTDPQVFFTESYVARNRACIRGALAAVMRPISIATLLSQCGVEERLFYSIIDNLMEMKQVPGVITGKQQSGGSMYIPTIYSKSQNDWVNSFYKQNGYLEYDALSRLGISDPQLFVRKHFPNEKLLLLPSCAVGPQIFDQIEAAVEEAISTGSMVDVMPLLPSLFEPEDAEEILTEVLKNFKNKSPNQNVHIFCNSMVLTEQFMQKLAKPFDAIIQKKAEEIVSSGVYLSAQAESKLQNNRSLTEQDEPSSKADRREERRKKATGGKGGGGTQGRETKTKSTKKKYQRGKVTAGDSDEEVTSSGGKASKSGVNKLEMLNIEDIKEVLITDEFLQEDDFSELITEIANYLHPSLNKTGLAAAQVVFESTMASTAQNRRKTHSELQDKLNAMVTNVRLFEKGLKQFSDKDVQQQLIKYLLKTLCTEITNEIFSYVAQENMIQYDQTKELSPEIRMKILNDAPNESKESLLKLHKSLNNNSVDEVLNCIETALGPGVCDMILRKPDKKKERPQLLGHRQALLEQLTASEDPALVLHLTSLILFQAVTQTMLHASGRFVSNILTYLQSHVTAEVFNTLQRYHDLVLKLLTTSSDDTNRSEVVNLLQEGMPAIKEIATTFKKHTSSEKKDQQLE